MTIGALARQAQVNVQTVRYYERIGLLDPVERRDSGYRVYNPSSLDRLRFIKRAQELGFRLDDVQELLALRNPGGPGTRAAARRRARERALARLGDIRERIASLRKLEATLSRLVRDCERGAETGDCPILERLKGTL